MAVTTVHSDLLYGQTKPLLPPQKEPRDLTATADPHGYQQVPWCTAIRAHRCQLPPPLCPRCCSQLRVLCRTAAWTALPRLTPLPLARVRQAPAAVCLHAAALPPITSLHCPEGSNAQGRQCRQRGSLRSLACGLNQARPSLSLACATLLLRNQPPWLHTGMPPA